MIAAPSICDCDALGIDERAAIDRGIDPRTVSLPLSSTATSTMVAM